ncbi:right-handed parallel beta-helix repeat-containing protein [Streptococcus merionis]|uniref:right-handed parallel beta-helix repeat-containing protein n=1 Tax=Streptococcus merionis TaxID=400065 RepID=UPI0026F01EF9|nr:right-handed parallel beta-helix repeat-containing protein [Streptococcus merionis]
MKKKHNRYWYGLGLALLLASQSTSLISAQDTERIDSGTVVESSASSEETLLKRPTHTVTLKVKTDGVPSDAGGRLDSVDGVLSGIEGTPVHLKVTANPGYRFIGYESYITDSGNSTDGLLPIENHRFDISDKIGNTTVYALFEKIPVDPNVYFADDFSGITDSVLSRYTLSDNLAKQVIVADGRLEVQAPGISSLTPVLDRAIEEDDTLGYQVSFKLQQIGDVKPWNTFRIAFREGADGSIYALELNGKKAVIKKLESSHAANNTGEALSEPVNLELGSNPHDFLITVKNGTISVTDNELPLISYSTKDNWGGSSAKIAFNPVSNRSIALDDLTIAKTKDYKKVNLIYRLDGQKNSAGQAGVVKGHQAEVAVGEALKLSATAKVGYRFEGFKDAAGNLLDLEQYRVPSNAEEPLIIYADFITSTEADREAKTFYIDSQEGQDTNSGEDEAHPLRSLASLKETTLVAGDRVLFKKGSVFTGKEAAISFKGSGAAGSPILISTYGEGERPRFDAQGEVENVLSLYNQEYITVEGLEITNLDAQFDTSFGLNTSNNRSKALRGVRVIAENYGVVHDITLRDLYIHDINGQLNSKWNGGIFFDAQGVVGEGVPTKYDGILIENNILERVDRSGMKLIGSSWANQSSKNNKNTPLNWYPSTNVVVRGNRIDKAGGDAITVRDTDGALVEYNHVSDSRFQDTGYNAGIWPFQTTNSVIQYNEVYRTHGVTDGQGLDLDHVSSNSVMQYNYSHDNEGGFMLIMNGFEHTSPTIRYNISQNDKDKTFEFARGTPSGTAIYNNTIYSDAKLTGRGAIIDVPNTKAGTGNRDAFFFNNVFHFVDGEEMYVAKSDALQYLDKLHFYNNAYIGVKPPAEEKQAITEGISFNGLGTGPTENSHLTPNTGKYLTNQLDGYKLTTGSALETQGVSLKEALAHFYKELGVSQQVDMAQTATMSPTDAFALAKTTNSVDAIARSYPKVAGVTYDTDFFGNSLSATSVSVGAYQAMNGSQKPSDDLSTDENSQDTDNTTTDSSQDSTTSSTETSATKTLTDTAGVSTEKTSASIPQSPSKATARKTLLPLTGEAPAYKSVVVGLGLVIVAMLLRGITKTIIRD